MTSEALSEPNMIPIKLEKRYPESKDEDITDAFMQGYLNGKADRPTGEWVDGDGNNVPLHKDGYPLRSCYCNQCHEWLVGSDEYYTKGNFCPNCGAKMKGGDDE